MHPDTLAVLMKLHDKTQHIPHAALVAAEKRGSIIPAIPNPLGPNDILAIRRELEAAGMKHPPLR